MRRFRRHSIGERFDRQRTDIDEVNADDNVDVTVLQGIEAEITADGLEIPEGWCADCDLIVAGLHGRLRDPTDRVIDAFRESPIDMFAHPTNRLRTEREPLDLDLDAVMEAAAAERVAIEINAQPERLDLEWESVKEYRETVRYVVSTDAHTTGELDTMDLGISQARPAAGAKSMPSSILVHWKNCSRTSPAETLAQSILMRCTTVYDRLGNLSTTSEPCPAFCISTV